MFDLRIKKAFSLMEMMVVMLIVAVVAAATAPMIGKKMSASSGGLGDSYWTLDEALYFDMNNIAVVVGSKNVAQRAAFGAVSSANPQIVFGPTRDRLMRMRYSSDNSLLIGNNDTTSTGGSISIGRGAKAVGDSVVVGTGSTAGELRSVVVGKGSSSSGSDSVAVGYIAKVGGLHGVAVGNDAQASGNYSVALGSLTRAYNDYSISIGDGAHSAEESVSIGHVAISTGKNSVVIGYEAKAEDTQGQVEESTAIGHKAKANAKNSTALGSSTNASGETSTALGCGASANREHSTAIGAGAVADHINEIALGTKNDTVYIPGNLVVGGNLLVYKRALLGYSGQKEHAVIANVYDGDGYHLLRMGASGGNIIGKAKYGYKSNPNEVDFIDLVGSLPDLYESSLSSDRRLKNVGEKFKGGLAELKKLDLYHYTYKKDEAKTPHVGVMAQDLQKVFPTAVTTGEDGFLRIRWDEMFYALINSVKELDSKIANIVSKVDKMFDEIVTIQNKNTEQDEQIKLLIEENKKLQERVAQLEKKASKK